MAAGHPFLKAALELNLLTPAQAEGLAGAADPRQAALEGGMLDLAACQRVDALAGRPAPAGRLITKRREEPDSARTATLARPGPGAPAAPEDPAGFWEALAPLPEQVGVYRILGEVARGGMGIVARAYHPGLDKHVAIKLLHPEAQGNPDMEERFLREARAAARLRHPGIVAVHDVARDADGRIYLVMDLVEGQSLKMRLEQGGPLEPREAARLVEAVARAVGYAHGQGTLHRDIKPHNVLIDRETGQPLLTDFGLAKAVGDAADSSGALRRPEATPSARAAGHELTRTGDLVGTPLYMAPEQLDQDGRGASVRSDVWALGVMLYECLTGTTPFDAEGTEDVFRRIMFEAPERPSRWEPGIPPALEAIVLRCLERNPARRYASAEELANELAGWLRGSLVLAHGPVRRVERGGALPLLVLGGLVLGLAALGWKDREVWSVAWSRLRGDPPPVAAPPRPPEPLEPARLPELGPPEPSALGEPGDTLEPLHRGNVARMAEAGHPAAMFAYGWALASGQLGAPDPALGRRWLERAAEAGHERAYATLGVALLEGRHLPRDPAAAREWFQRGAQAGVVECMLRLGQLERAEDPRAARAAWEQAAGRGSIPAMLLLTELLQRSEPGAALAWLERADEAGDARASLWLGQAHQHGLLGLSPSPARARLAYERARERGSPEAEARLAGLRR